MFGRREKWRKGEEYMDFGIDFDMLGCMLGWISGGSEFVRRFKMLGFNKL